MKFTQIPATAFQSLQLNAGVLLSSFAPATAEVSADALLGATSGGVTFTAQPSYSDFGDDIDNCPKNMKELKRLDSWEAKLSGTFVTITPAAGKRLTGAADIDSTDATKVTPRNDLADTDFSDIWWVGDYSDKNGATKGGFVAIHMLNSLSTGGFQLKSSDRAKGQFSFEFTGHYSMDNQDQVPFEIYVKSGADESADSGNTGA